MSYMQARLGTDFTKLTTKNKMSMTVNANKASSYVLTVLDILS